VIARRRRFSLEQKQLILAEADQTSVAATARRHGVARSLLQRWKMMGIESSAGRSTFVRLLPTRSADDAAPSAAPASIYIHVDQSLIIELPATVDPQQVAALVTALKA
jgi:transposase-like protein